MDGIADALIVYGLCREASPGWLSGCASGTKPGTKPGREIEIDLRRFLMSDSRTIRHKRWRLMLSATSADGTGADISYLNTICKGVVPLQ